MRLLHLARLDQLSKVAERAVVGPFRIRRKTAGRKLPALQVIADAVTAKTLSGTGVGPGEKSCFFIMIIPPEILGCSDCHKQSILCERNHNVKVFDLGWRVAISPMAAFKTSVNRSSLLMEL